MDNKLGIILFETFLIVRNPQVNYKYLRILTNLHQFSMYM